MNRSKKHLEVIYEKLIYIQILMENLIFIRHLIRSSIGIEKFSGKVGIEPLRENTN